MIPSIPTLAQSIVRILSPCLPYILASEENWTIAVTLPPEAEWPVITQAHLEMGQTLWEHLWPYITADHEAKIAAQEVALDFNSPTWRSTFEQGLIGILTADTQLTATIAKVLKIDPDVSRRSS